MAENNTKAKEQRAPLTRKQRITIIGLSIIAGLLLCICLIWAFGSGNSYELSGTYVTTVGTGDVSGTSKYIFDGNKVTNEYNVSADTKVIEYTYKIKKSGSGRIIVLKEVETGEERVFSFAEKTENGVESIIINTLCYDKEQ